VPSSEKPQYQLNDALYLVKHLMGLKRLPLVQAALLRHYNKAENLKLKAENSDKVQAEQSSFYSQCYHGAVDEYSSVLDGLEACDLTSRKFPQEEKKFVDAFLRLSVNAFYDLSELGLGDLLVLPSHIGSLSFDALALPLVIVTPLPSPPIRSSIRGEGGDELMALDFSHETAVQRSPPVPKAFSSLDTCFIEVVALVEFVSETRLGTSAVNPTGIDEAIYSAAQRAFSTTHLMSPLGVKSTFGGITRQEVSSLVATISRYKNPVYKGMKVNSKRRSSYGHFLI